ncbi:hypothetical protein FRC0421_02165 [Corynebacterium diphtheriae]|nr:hypothetical protein FRC0209_02211 [Corynebacterium diphtheriae]CAB0855394.1 hypothetical protein FRC0323_01700 [Corynebacterium diphtheriae]CAB0919179.1 hypothetical protein FRC0421_02165 [Corynebacterium diphtheriae]
MKATIVRRCAHHWCYFCEIFISFAIFGSDNVKIIAIAFCYVFYIHRLRFSGHHIFLNYYDWRCHLFFTAR